jgi:hypothetical protein
MPHRLRDAAASLCPECDSEYASLAQHWSRGQCDPPAIDAQTRALLDGLVLGDASLEGAKTAKLRLETTHREFALWIHDQLGWLSRGVMQHSPGSDGTHPVYRVTTLAHPGLNDYREWWSDDVVAPPASWDPDQRSMRVWYACDGGLSFEGFQIQFRAVDDRRASTIARVLRGVPGDLDPAIGGGRVRLRGADAVAFLDAIGEPLPGVAYKWACQQPVYRSLKASADDGDPVLTHDMDTADRYGELLRTLADALGAGRADLSPVLLRDALGGVVPRAISETLGGGDWSDALRAASVPTKTGDSHTADDPQWPPPNYSRQEILDAIRTVDERIGDQLLSKRTYDKHRDDSHPAGETITNRFRWTDIKADARVDTQPRTDDLTEAAALDALREVAERVDETLTMDWYDAARDDAHPNSRSIAAKFGWNDSKAKVGLEVDNRGSWEREDS